jgi:hypothetical protein
VDTSRPPHGERTRKAILDAIVAMGDMTEKHYLEVKSELNIAAKADIAKIAKFILGAANRSPQTADRHFGGYAVMVLGAKQGGLPGVASGIEVLHIEDKIKKYIKPGSVHWELERAPADVAGREVLFIIVDPPRQGDPVHVCRGAYQSDDRKNTKNDLADGDIYVRGVGATAKATSAELDALHARATGKSVTVPEISVEIQGQAHYLDDSARIRERFIEVQIDQAHERYVQPPGAFKAFNPLVGVMSPALLGGPAPSSMSEDGFTRRAEKWGHKIRASWLDNTEKMAGAALPGALVKVSNAQSGFLEGVRIDLILENAYGVQFLEPGDIDVDKLFPPVIEPRTLYDHGLTSLIDDQSWRTINPRGYPLTWANQDDQLRITVKLEDLPPETPWVSDGDDFVVIARNKDAESITGSWRATMRGHDRPHVGTLTLPTGKLQDFVTLHQLLMEQTAHKKA